MNVVDVAIIGSGLSGSLLALSLKKFHPELRVAVYDKSSEPCGNHTWCFHDPDIPENLRAWLTPLISKSWDGYDVHFPKYKRTLRGKYHSIKSEDLRATVLQELGPQFNPNHDFVGSVAGSEGSLVLQFKNQTSRQAQAVVLAQGWRQTLNSTQLGWQKFVGLEVELESPHELTRPILKDVLQEQKDGYRFIYSLPFDATTLLIEDTYYSNSSALDVESLEEGICQYAKSKNWKIRRILRKEVGCLPLFLDAPAREEFSLPRIGAGSQFVNPVTGYTLPMTLQVIDALVLQKNFSNESIKKAIHHVELKFNTNTKYLITLNRMMFLAAAPEKRYQILERFYGLSEALIGRFYAANLTFFDRVRILTGKPPVPVARAVRALVKNLSSAGHDST